MKILVICQYYYPEPFRITDICEELVKQGNSVTVVTGIPNYPMGEIYNGYKDKSKRDEVINGVHVHRCLTIPRKHGPVFRLLNYFSFPLSSNIYIKKLKGDYDAILVNQLSPVMMAKAGITYKKKYNKKLVLYCLDLWPESLKAGGINEKGFLFKIFHKISKKIYTQCDEILVTSNSFKDYLKKEFNIIDNKIAYLPQYAETIFTPEECYKRPNKNVDLLFAGNIGKAQSIDTIVDAANILRDNKNIYFHIVGDGQELERIQKKVKKLKLKNMIFYGRKPLEEMPKFYKKADAMIVTLCGDGGYLSSTLPGKVQTCMAAGKPIIAAANGETKMVIDEAQCGFCGKADNVEEFSENIKKFADSNCKKKLGNNSYNYYINNFVKGKYIKKLIKILENKGDKK